MARLRVEQGKSQGKTVEFDKQAVIGRGETAQLQINDTKASREHFKVFEQAGTWSVADLNSRNGIKVNGVSTTRKTLSSGDKIEVGETVILFEITVGATTPKTAAAVAAGAADTGDMPAVKGAPPAPAGRPGGTHAGAAVRKAAAMADARAAASAKAAPAAAKPSAAKGSAGQAAATGKGLEVSDRVLQFHKVDTKKATVMDVDLTQSPGTTKFLIFLGCAAFLGLLAWLFSTLAQ